MRPLSCVAAVSSLPYPAGLSCARHKSYSIKYKIYPFAYLTNQSCEQKNGMRSNFLSERALETNIGIVRKLFVVGAALVVASCASAGVKVEEAQVKNFQKGKTTSSEIVERLGAPTERSLAADGTTKI